MSVTIRLSRTGRKNLPSYRVVVANTRDKRDGKVLDILGFYNPSLKTPEIKIDAKKVEEWQKKGALLAESVKKLMAGTYVYNQYKGKKNADQKSA